MKKLLAALSLIVMTALEAQNGNSCSFLGYNWCCCEPFYVGADWLYWKTDQSQMEYAFSDAHTTSLPTPGGTATTDGTRNLAPDFSYESGYRLFIDHMSCHSRWRMSLAYTHAPSCAQSSFTGFTQGFTTSQFATLNPTNFTLFQILSEELGTTEFQLLSARWRSSFNYLDFDLARIFTPCDSLEIVPNFGIRALWMRQSFDVNGSNGPTTFLARMSGKIDSVGFEGGLNVNWHFYENFSLETHLGAALLYGRFHTKGSQALNTAKLAFLTTTNKEVFNRCLPMIDLFVGLAYDDCACGWPYEIHFGWEDHLLLNTNLFSTKSLGSTNLQGLTLGGSVAF